MENFDRKNHWNTIYQNKKNNEVGWYQEVPTTSIEFLKQFNLPSTAKIIDIGGGDSFFVDHMIDMGFQDITVLDVSEKALEKAKKRLGDKAAKINWIIADASEFTPTRKYDFWHDRAAFHFLTKDYEINHYINSIRNFIKPEGLLVIGTFSVNGPKKCSGIEIKQYSEKSMTGLLGKYFEKIKCITVDHITPFNTVQNFVFCSFKRVEGL